jgi:hypothetical protein
MKRLRRIQWNSLPTGQGELKNGAARLVSLCPQPASMGVDYGTADRQPHSQADALKIGKYAPFLVQAGKRG